MKVERLTKRLATTADLNKTSLPKRQRTGPASSSLASAAALVEVSSKLGMPHVSKIIHFSKFFSNSQIEPVDNVCKGRDFCVAVKSGPAADELKNMVRRHGGNIVVNPGNSLCL